MTPVISAVVCTYNRCDSLRDTLQSLRKQKLAGGQEWEVVVVDNNSTDRTKQIVEEMARVFPCPVRYAHEPNQGIAYARNRGLVEARGRYVAFIDDDAVAEPEWLAAVVRCFEETNADLVGGKIGALWQVPRPAWLTSELMGPVTFLDMSPTRKCCATETFLTANCSLRKASLDRFGVFDATLGRRGERWVGGEDLELCKRWHAKGAAVYYEPTAVVQHKVNPQRVTPEFYRRWYEDIGYTQGHQLDWKWHYAFLGMPIWRWKALLRAWFRHTKANLANVPEDARLATEFWWVFESSFLTERLDHWVAHWAKIANPRCHFIKAT